MEIRRGMSEERDGLVHLQAESLRIIALFVGAIGYVWLALVIWPITGGPAPIEAWVGSSMLVLSVCLSYALKDRFLHAASDLLVWATLIAIACLVLAFRTSGLAYLFILPVIFASVLLSQKAVFLMASLANFLIVTISVAHLGLSLFSTAIMLPVIDSSESATHPSRPDRASSDPA